MQQLKATDSPTIAKLGQRIEKRIENASNAAPTARTALTLNDGTDSLLLRLGEIVAGSKKKFNELARQLAADFKNINRNEYMGMDAAELDTKKVANLENLISRYFRNKFKECKNDQGKSKFSFILFSCTERNDKS